MEICIAPPPRNLHYDWMSEWLMWIFATHHNTVKLLWNFALKIELLGEQRHKQVNSETKTISKTTKKWSIICLPLEIKFKMNCYENVCRIQWYRLSDLHNMKYQNPSYVQERFKQFHIIDFQFSFPVDSTLYWHCQAWVKTSVLCIVRHIN